MKPFTFSLGKDWCSPSPEAGRYSAEVLEVVHMSLAMDLASVASQVEAHTQTAPQLVLGFVGHPDAVDWVRTWSSRLEVRTWGVVAH